MRNNIFVIPRIFRTAKNYRGIQKAGWPYSCVATRALPLLLLLTSCTSQQQPCIRYIECPDGINDCQEQARELCPKGYSLMNDSDVGSDFSDFAKEHFAGASAGVPHIVAQCNQ